MGKLAQNRRGATRPILREPPGSDAAEIESLRRVARDGRKVTPKPSGRNRLGDALAGNKTSGGGRLSGGVYNGPVG